jgi:cellulose synthase/poly-beta-1,6-N-acetylglucosamine synthase-like glycosyltransferase
MKIGLYKEMAKKYKNVQVYQLPEKLSLGTCLNYAVKKTKYSYIAKFDDDDYYAPYYLTDNMGAFNRTKADIVGKCAHFMYLRGSKMLILRFHKHENRYVSIVPGATLVFKRKVFRKVRFPNQSIGEDTQFCLKGKAKGYKIYSAGKHNFVAVRRKNSKDHTWIISDKKLLESNLNIKYPHVRAYKKYVLKRPKDFN